MIFKTKEKERAIKLRKRGHSYREILKEVPVAKSTLSLWLRDVGLSKPQKQKITQKRLDAGIRGGEARRRERIKKTKEIMENAVKDIDKISKRELWLMGIMLYWAEGAKEKKWSGATLVNFTNSDANMVILFIKWLSEIIHIPNDQITGRIHIHENHRLNIQEIEKYWLNISRIPKKNFIKPNFKKHNPKTIRHNIGDEYKGLLEVGVRKSTSLNRKIAGWVDGINKHYRLN